MSPTIGPDPAEPALGAMFVAGETIEGYVDGARRSGLEENAVDGMVLHWSAQTPEGTLTGTLWRERTLAERFLADVLAVAFTDLVGATNQNDALRTDYSYEISSIVAFVPGADASMVTDRKLGGAGGAVLIRPRGEPDEAMFRARALSIVPPAGMITHVASTNGEAVHWQDVWLDRAAPEDFYEQAGIDSASLEVIPLHTLFANPVELTQLPRFPRSR